jgi:hypothetical protein
VGSGKQLPTVTPRTMFPTRAPHRCAILREHESEAPTSSSSVTEPRPDGLDSVFERSAQLTCAVHRNVIIVVWRITPTVAAMHRIEKYLDAHPVPKIGKVGAVVITEFVTLTPPEREVLQCHARITKRFEQHGLGIALVVDGSTALKAVVRFVLSTLQLMSSPRIPQAIFDSDVAASAWLATLDTAIDKPKLVAAIKQARTVRLPPVAAAS